MKNAHKEFDFSFMQARVRQTLQLIETQATAGITDAINADLIGGAQWPAQAMNTIDQLESMLRALAARRSEIVELLDEKQAEGAA